MSDSSISKHIPEGKTWLRAAVSSIPMVGSALDHLIFDKADSIRTSNLEAALNAVSHRLEQIPENLIDKEWFQSEEALATFRLLSEKTSFEPDKQKIQDLGRVAATCGTTSLSKDSKKLSVFDHISRLSPVLHFPRKPIGEQAPADEISPPHLRGRKLSQPGSVR